MRVGEEVQTTAGAGTRRVLACGFQIGQHLLVGRIDFQAFLVDVDRFVVALEKRQGGALARVALGEVGFECDALVRVLERLFVLVGLGVGSRSVAVENVIALVEFDRLRVETDRFVVLAG